MTQIWIVEGFVTDPDAHNGKAELGDTEWQFSDGPAGKRGSSADYLSLEEGMRDHPDCTFVFDPEPDPETKYKFLVEFTVPLSELKPLWRNTAAATLADLLQRDFYDVSGMAGQFQVLEGTKHEN
jgi:hypothetical protein